MYQPNKNPGTASLLAFIGGMFALPGIGHIYVRKVGTGLVVLISGFTIYALTFAMIISVTSIRAYQAQDSPTGNAPPMAIDVMIILLALVISYIVLFIWQTISARKLAQKFNNLVKTTGAEPW